ncbi:MAG: 1-(5-phosphoribosyl)-5-[(5-phosphoribosylamino)methylideneamino]imidazole-4-carboxamide isomerase [Actinobacteria bacterium RBG_16_64_13]|nr:MAG: 1-(5-phosphoribosyl)-5-[(5-phosphoribosylamino)methylideneamino]imidazole-4-carboxamide isomerase [Actinobacteria bacterium RBG_16_64_13]
MRLIPAIDIRGGKCVRLRKGDFADETVFGDDPVAMAERWVREGARFLHVVDLDGAREGVPRNFALIQAVAEAVAVPVETGGGIRSEVALQLVAGSRVAKAVLGTSAVDDESFLERALAVLGPARLVVAVDAEDGFVKTKGWQERSGVRVPDLALRLRELGVREILYTDISRDGMMQSVDLTGIRELAENSGLEIIASGGVTSLDDLRALRELAPLGVTGVIAGRALYEERFTVAEALAVLDAAPGGVVPPRATGAPRSDS